MVALKSHASSGDAATQDGASVATGQLVDSQDRIRLRQLIQARSLDDALPLSDRLLSSAPDDVEILALAAMVQRQLNNCLAAVELMHKATRLRPGNKALWVSYSSDLLKIGRIEDAQAAFGEIDPERRADPDVQLLKSRIYYQQCEFEAATQTLVHLVTDHRDFAAAHMELAHALLMRGKWRAGWMEYETRYHLRSSRSLLPKFKIPHWDGKTLDDAVLLIADQGYGDCFQFCRYIPLVSERCGKVILVRSEPMARILDTVPGVAESYTQWRDVPRAGAYSTLSGLPRLFATRPHNIPDCRELLRIPEDANARWAEKVRHAAPTARLRIGVAWSGRLEFRDNFLRSVPIAAFEPLFEVAQAQFFSLQTGPLAEQANAFDMVNLTAELSDFAETAAEMQALDLIITSDTAIAHLAGTLGRPTWVLLAKAPDWRWGPDGCHSDWYWSVRLFRQDHTRSWNRVISAVKLALETILARPDPSKALEKFTVRRPQPGQ